MYAKIAGSGSYIMVVRKPDCLFADRRHHTLRSAFNGAVLVTPLRTLPLAFEPLLNHFAAMQNRTEPETTIERTFIEAIALRRVITATYNGCEMRLAPHQLFNRHGELFVGAFNTGKNRRDDDERRLGYFKLEGLSNVTATKDTFDPLPSFDGTVPKVGDEQLFSVSSA